MSFREFYEDMAKEYSDAPAQPTPHESAEQAARAMVEEAFEVAWGHNVPPKREVLVEKWTTLLLAQRAAVLEAFKKHHDECNDFRHCECASAFWYEYIGKPWMEEKKAKEAS